MVGFLYLIMTIGLALLVRLMENRMGKGQANSRVSQETETGNGSGAHIVG